MIKDVPYSSAARPGPAAPGTQPETVIPPASDAQVMQYLENAATRSAASLIDEAARLVSGSAALTHPVSGPIFSSSARPAAQGPISSAEENGDHGALGEKAGRTVAGAILTVAAGPGVSARRNTLVFRTTARLLRVRANRAFELQAFQMRVHQIAVDLLLRGDADRVAQIIGDLPEHATVYRLVDAGDDPKVYEAVWAAVLPVTVREFMHTLVARIGGDLAVVVLHQRDSEDRRPGRLIAHAVEQYNLLGAVADPCSPDRLGVAWAETGRASRTATSLTRLAPAGGLGESSLVRILPAKRYAAWADTLLSRLNNEHRRTAEAWLRCGSVHSAAEALGITRVTVHAHIHSAEQVLGADLTRADTRAALHLALAAPPPTMVSRHSAVEPTVTSLLALVSPSAVLEWAENTLAPLTNPLRIALRVWLEHDSNTSRAAKALGQLSPKTMKRWLDEIGEMLEADIGSPRVRAELYIATTIGSMPQRLQRRGGRYGP